MTRIYYWDCKYGDADEQNIGDDENPDYEWVYYCSHPKNIKGRCVLEDKYDEEEDCPFLDETQQ